jgi:hypothetical protein
MINHVSPSEVVSFAHDKRLDEIYGDERKQILALFDEISTIYKNAMNRKWDGRCDICGKGDKNEIFRISNVVKGYEHRINSSPILCWGHARGWNKGIDSKQFDSILARCLESDEWKIVKYAYRQEMLDKYGLSDEEIDLHFAEYLTKQLFRVARNQKQGEVNEAR